MKKFNLVLLVLVAVLFGSSFVACSNGHSGDFDLDFEDSDNPGTDNSNNESYVTEDYNGLSITFIPVSGCTTVDEIGHPVTEYSDNFEFEDYFDETRANAAKNGILNNPNLYHNNDYIIVRLNNDISSDAIYKLEITGDVVNLRGTGTSSAVR